MSAHSFPSLISDSSSLSRSSDLHESIHERLSPASLTPTSTTSISLSHKDPENSEILQLRTKVSKLEQDKFVLGDYAAELQSRIRQLERERMEHQDPINDQREPELAGQAECKQSNILPSSRPNSPIIHTNSNGPSRSSFHRPSSSLSAATSTAAKRAIARASPRGTPSPTPSQLAFPSSTTKIKLVPKRSSRLEAPEAISSPQSQSSDGRPDCQYESMTPTRRRLQAMYGLFSSETSPHSSSPGGGESSRHDMNGRERVHAHRAHSMRITNSKPSTPENGRDHETKRTAFTSKLDSIILTSKLFPLPSSRSKAPLAPVSSDRHLSTSHTAVIPLTHSAPSSTPYAGNIFLDSPPNKNVKVQLPRKGHNPLSQSLGLEENRRLDINNDRKATRRSRGRVSFSDRLFSSSPDRGDETDTDTEHVGGIWGSWSKKKRPPPLSFSKEKPTSSPPSTPPSAFTSRLSRSHAEHPGDPEDRRKAKRRSLAAGCLRTLVSGSSERDKTFPEDQRERRVLRRSHSETRRSRSRSRSRSAPAPPGPTQPEIGATGVNPSVGSKDEKRRITPSRVGSPMPKGRLPELQGGNELDRTSSMRSAGKWGQRGRGFSTELTRRRTIHPMFSFERPGSAGAASTSSSRRNGEKADDEEKGDERRGPVAKSPGLARPATNTIPESTVPAPYELVVSQSQVTHTQDHSHASGHTGCTGITRSEPGTALRSPMMRTRLGMQSHGTFAFEPAAAVVYPPHSAPPLDANRSFVRGENSAASLSRKTGSGLVRSLSTTNGHGNTKSNVLDRRNAGPDKKTKEREYLVFCEELKAVLGDGEDWSAFKKYVRRFDLEVLSAEVLVQRVKKLIDGHRSVDGATRLRLYERFVKIVHDNLNE